ncbi:hypothetical protein F511_44743 [Dorcoceras hygrometricum]|uniref:Uncharacterized protein n=1 Tax=Dorcoceras hygrometricum TaxID=472368 RepID=A0A2Z7AM42_9LAMI|nr:hypothetical protein F511_44743 [Dorcoceras hygrometricum]
MIFAKNQQMHSFKSDPVATQRYSVEDFQTLYLMNQSQDSVAIFQQKREEKQQST